MRILNKIFQWLITDQQKPGKSGLDNNILFSAIILLTIGVVMVYSASIAYAGKDSGSGNQYYYFIRH
ncbi:MAG TPA: hypothetical protein DHV02_00505, partial [Neisseriales bacterium]|nr:hypothetical protein [Neisseriales bacterium]